MASSRRSGARSQQPRRARTARSAPSSSPPLVLIGSLVLGVAVIALVFVIGGNSSDANAAAQPGAGASPAAPSNAAAARTPDPTPATSRPGSTPGRPAPAIPDEVWPAADDLYDRAAELWNEGQAHRRAGRTAEYQKSLLGAWDVLEQLSDKIEPYTDWFEEADLEGWAMPEDYSRLHARLEVWDVLRGKVRKLKPMNRR